MPTFLRRLEWVLTILVVLAMFVAIHGAFLGAPKESAMGNVQRLFYFHVPFAIGCFLGFFVVLVGSVGYLIRRDRTWDLVAESAAEIGVLYCTIVLITGPIWARPIWGTWWTWDPRLTMTVILWTIYAVYLVLRTGAREDPQMARYAAVLAIIGVLDVPLTKASVRLWRGIHPSVISAPADKGGLEDPRMVVALLVTMVAFALLFLWLLWLRYEGLRLRDALHRVEDRMGDIAR